MEVNRMIDQKNFRKSIGAEEKQEVEKTRYKVEYEFRTDSGNSYTGEFFVYNESEDIKEGNYIDIRYNPDNPKANFSSYSTVV